MGKTFERLVVEIAKTRKRSRLDDVWARVKDMDKGTEKTVLVLLIMIRDNYLYLKELDKRIHAIEKELKEKTDGT
jgi:hypothetical protein